MPEPKGNISVGQNRRAKKLIWETLQLNIALWPHPSRGVVAKGLVFGLLYFSNRFGSFSIFSLLSANHLFSLYCWKKVWNLDPLCHVFLFLWQCVSICLRIWSCLLTKCAQVTFDDVFLHVCEDVNGQWSFSTKFWKLGLDASPPTPPFVLCRGLHSCFKKKVLARFFHPSSSDSRAPAIACSMHDIWSPVVFTNTSDSLFPIETVTLLSSSSCSFLSFLKKKQEGKLFNLIPSA